MSLMLCVFCSLFCLYNLLSKPFSHMHSVFSRHLYRRTFDREGHSHLFTLHARNAGIGVAQKSVYSTGGLEGRLARGGI